MVKKGGKKKVKKNVATGIAHIQSTFNNTIVTITDPAGDSLRWSSAPASTASRARASRRPSRRSWPPRTAQEGDGARRALASRCS